MKTIFSDKHALQSVETEFYRGKWVEAFEIPRRAELVLAEVKRANLGPVIAPESFGLAPVLATHDADFVHFLETAWEAWKAEVGPIPAYPNIWPPRRSRMIPTVRPGAELGRYAVDMSSPILPGTWEAARAAVDSALTGVQLIEAGDPAAFALCRPPGHHAGRDYFGGYCFLNNAAIAAQHFRDLGAERVAVLDIDYHHGNGTQDIFWSDPSVSYFSSHQSPLYPGTGDPHETGRGNIHNAVLKSGSGSIEFRAAWSQELLPAMRALAPQWVMISAGFDAHYLDPLAGLAVTTEDFHWLTGELCRIADESADGRVISMLEGGYSLSALSACAVTHVEALMEST